MIQKSKTLSLLPLWFLINLAGACGHSTTPGTSTPKREAKALPKVLNAVVLVGSDKVEVTLLELADDRALILLKGAEGDFFGKVMEHTRSFSNHGFTRYSTSYNGKPFVTLDTGEKDGKEIWQLLTPIRNFRYPVFRDRLRTKTLDTSAILRLHQTQDAEGTLAAVAGFDRRRNERAALKPLQSSINTLEKSCGARPALQVSWSGVSDQQMIKRDYSGTLSVILKTFSQICESSPGRTFVQAHPTQQVSFGERLTVTIEGQALRWTLPHHISYSDVGKVIDPLHALPLEGKPLGQQIATSDTEICETPEKKLVILAPNWIKHYGVSYGKGRRFSHIRGGSGNKVWTFFEPRFLTPRKRKNDLQHRSSVRVDRKAGKCTLKCSLQVKELKLLPRAEIPPILEKAIYVAPPHKRKPYALARNRQGIYYFVDRGTTPTTLKDFRVFIGRRGRMRAQKMKDIVSDSKGEIFSTRTGDLRLVVSNTQAIWITKRREHDLLWLPIKENLSMIYNELGPYLGQPLGTPCDDF